MPDRPRRAWPALDPALFASTLVVYAAGLPLGLDRVAAAPKVAAGLALDTTGLAQGTPLDVLAARVIAYLPLGDAATRANLAAALLGALAVTLVGRLCVNLLALFRPTPHARLGPHHFAYEPLVAAGAALTTGLSLAVYQAVTSAGAAAATLVLLAAAWLAAVRLLSGSGRPGHGLALALLAGLAAGVDPIAGPLLWPLALGLWIWELRRGERWPLWAPLLFVAGLGATVLATTAASQTPLNLTGVLRSSWPSGTHGGAALTANALELCDEVGVVALLLGGLGVLKLLVRAPLVAIWCGFTVLTALLLGHGPQHTDRAFEPARGALPAAVLAAALPIGAGIVHLAGRLGRARPPVAMVLAVLSLISPTLDGGTQRWVRDTRRPHRLLEHGLARAPVSARVEPGSREMSGLFHYAQTLGWRPDLEIAAGPLPPPRERDAATVRR